MAVYALCKECRGRREMCQNPTAHKRFVLWRADVQFTRSSKRLRKTFRTAELAEIQERQWRTDYERGLLLPKSDTLLFNDLADRYFNEHVIPHVRYATRTVQYEIGQLRNYFGPKTIGKITRDDCKAFQAFLREKVSASRVNRLFNTLRAMFYKAVEWGLLRENPAEHITRLSENPVVTRILTREEIGTLIASTTHQKVKDYIVVLLHTGARPSSIRTCSWDNGDVDFESRTIWFTTYKGRKQHRYPHPIDDTLYALLQRRVKETGRKGRIFDTDNIEMQCKRTIKASGLNEGKAVPQWFKMYGLKHCYASYLLMSGASLDEVRRLLGHTDTKMLIKHYGHLTQDHLRKIQSRINLTEGAIV